jgi:uncharacterized protein
MRAACRLKAIAGMDLMALAPAFTVEGLGAAAGLVTGLASSAHCAVMCGPLACAAAAPADAPVALGRRRRRWRQPLAYHAGRVSSYAAVGTALGLAGDGTRHVLSAVAPALPWVMAGALTATALGVGKRLPVPGALRRLAQPLIRRAAKFSPPGRAAAIGAATPLLPCGTLYGLFVTAAATASAIGGAALMAAFALGATPVLALVQGQGPLLARHPRAGALFRRVVPLLAAAALVWRAVHAGDGSAPPACH